MTKEQLQNKVNELSENGEWNCFYEFPFNIVTRKNHINSPGYNLNKWQRLEPIINKINLKNRTLIDIGCGDGYYAIECAKKGANYVLGTDIDPIRIQRGLLSKEVFNLKNINFKCVDLYEDKIEKFDICMALGLLHRVPDINKCLKKLSSIADTLILEFKSYNTEKETCLPLNKKSKSNKFNNLYSVPSVNYIVKFLKELNFSIFTEYKDIKSSLNYKRPILVCSK